MNRQQKRQSKKSSTSLQQKNDWNIVMPKSDPLEQKSQNSEATPTATSPTQPTNTNSTQPTTTNTNSRPNEVKPQSQWENMNPAGETNATTPLPPPTHISEKSTSRASKKPEKTEVLTDALTPRQAKLAEKLAAAYATVGIFVSSRDAYDGVLLIKCSTNRAEEVVRAARHNKQVMDWLEKIVNGSDVGTAIFGHVIMLYAIMAHHGRIKGNDQLLATLGYHEAQVLAPPPGSEGMNGSVNGATQQFATI